MSFTPKVGYKMFLMSFDVRTSGQYESPLSEKFVEVTYAKDGEIRIENKRTDAYKYFKGKLYGMDCWRQPKSLGSQYYIIFESKEMYGQMLKNQMSLTAITSILQRKKHELTAQQIESILNILV